MRRTVDLRLYAVLDPARSRGRPLPELAAAAARGGATLVQYRDKAITNALLSKAVEVCASHQIPYLVYGFWNEGTLVDFKRHSGFERVDLPRYFVPLSAKGRFALRIGAHRGWKEMIPARIKAQLKRMRQAWQGLKAGQ